MPRSPIAFAGGLILSLMWIGCADPTGPRAASPPRGTPVHVSTQQPVDTEVIQLTETSGLAEYLAAAALNNPQMQAAFYRWQAADAQTPQAEALPDPKLTYRYFIEEVETRVGAQRQSVQLAQTLPPFGSLRLRGEAADKAADAARGRYEAVKLAVFYEVTRAYYEYYYLHRAIELTRENLDLVAGIESVAAARYRADAAQHADVIRAQVELGTLDDRLRTLTDLRTPHAARLNAAMNRPTDTELPWPEEMTAEPVTITEAQARQWLTETNPQLKALDSEVARRRAEVDLARKDYYPDLTFGVQWIDTANATGAMRPEDSGKDPWIAMVSVNVPLWRSKLDASLRQAKQQQAAATAERVHAANELESQLAMTLYQLADAQRKMNLYRDTLIPKAAESLSVIQSGYRSGKTGFIDLLDAVQVILEFQLAYERALADRAQRVGQLEMLVGRPIGAAGNPSAASAVLSGAAPSGG